MREEVKTQRLKITENAWWPVALKTSEADMAFVDEAYKKLINTNHI